MIGEVVGGFKLTEKLGQGATGETYLAEHHETGQKAAVKVLFEVHCNDAERIENFFAELRAASWVNHIGIADVYDCGTHANGRAFLVMEYFAGKSLTDALVELGTVGDIESFADIAWQLASMLQAAHEREIVHAALKPDGIFLTFPPQQSPRPLVKLIDFGMAKFTATVRRSQTGSLLGAPLYRSPEIGRGVGKADHRADIYSLGCILFEMVCGRPPFTREDVGELVIAHASEPPPLASSLEPSVPPAIDTLIGRMLTKPPAARPQTMAEVASVLAKFFKCPAPAPSQTALEVVQAPAFPFASTLVSSPTTPTATVEPRRPGRPFVAATAILEDQPLQPRPEPGAFLPPSVQDPLVSQSPAAGQDPAQQPWVARVRQRTVLFEAPPAPASRVRPFEPKVAKSSRRSGPSLAKSSRSSKSQPRRRRASTSSPAADGKPEKSSAINLPVVAISACVVLAVFAAALVFMNRKPKSGPAGEVAPDTTSGSTAEETRTVPEPTLPPAAQAPAATFQVPSPAQAGAPPTPSREEAKPHPEHHAPLHPAPAAHSAPAKTGSRHW